MISTLHYYNSFILDKEKRAYKASSYKYRQPSHYDKERTYFLNKALNDNVRTYIFELSSNFNGLKNTANEIYEKMNYNLPLEALEDNFKNFTFIYNRFIGFLQENTENSKCFKNILNTIKSIVNNNEFTLNTLGINISKNGFLGIDNQENIRMDIIDKNKVKGLYYNLYNKMCNFMEEPMSKHMDFKDFSYYFNYSEDNDKNKSFKIIQQGLLVDITL